MPHGPTAVVLGAGISGLSATRALQDCGLEPALLEACPEPGGLTRTTVVGGFAFDYTGHLLHLARHESPAAIPFADLDDADWMRVSRRSYCHVGGKLVTAPIQYHLGDLPPDLRERSIASYEARPKASAQPASFRDYVVQGFGQYLADLFLIPQNEKTMATTLDRLSGDAVRRFFPPPDEATVRRGMEPGITSPAEYNSRFWYPREGGINRLVHGLARGVRDLRLGSTVVAIDLPRRSLRTSRGDDLEWEFLVSSLPLSVLCSLTGDPELTRLARSLTHSTTVCINLGVRGELGAGMGDAQWIYVPDRDIPFYRVGAYSHISEGVMPPGHSAVYVEVGMPAEEAKQPGLLAALEPRVEQALHDLGWIRREQIVCRVTHLLECAYVHLTPERDKVVPVILGRLAEHGVYPIGRYGTWDYTSMEDSIVSGIETARRVAR